MIKMLTQIITATLLVFSPADTTKITNQKTLSTRELSLDQRHSAKSVNEVFKKNILLNLAYLNGSVSNKGDISWDKLTNQPIEFSFILKPGQTFAYHQDILPQFNDSLSLTTNSYFGPGQGYLFSGFLYGDGVCHLASLINWAAQDANLDVLVPKKHSIAHIPQIPDQYGVSIYIDPTTGVGENNNLYITNNKDTDIEFKFVYQNDNLEVSVIQTA